MDRFRIVESQNDGHCLIVELHDEDHTLGNSLRHVIMKNEDVIFCGYSLPHPNDRKVLMQIQTFKGRATGLAVLEKGFKDLIELCGIFKKTYEDAVQVHLSASS